MITLGIDTSNYATSLAVYSTEAKEVVCDKKRFLPIKDKALGLRQSEALFLHTKALPELLHELASEVALHDIDAVGVSVTPRPVEGSYMPCFLAGVNVAEAFALARNIPIIKASHQQGHIAAALYASDVELSTKALAFHISGGTTELLLTEALAILQKLGESTDLYAGQAVDRVGARLGLPFPSGVQLSCLAGQCNESIHPKISVKGLDCSFSGLENQCNALLAAGKSQEYTAKYCLSYIAYTVLAMIKGARIKYQDLPVICAGGVMSSDIIKDIVCAGADNVYFVPQRFSSDNAIGVAIIAAKGIE